MHFLSWLGRVWWGENHQQDNYSQQPVQKTSKNCFGSTPTGESHQKDSISQKDSRCPYRSPLQNFAIITVVSPVQFDRARKLQDSTPRAAVGSFDLRLGRQFVQPWLVGRLMLNFKLSNDVWVKNKGCWQQ